MTPIPHETDPYVVEERLREAIGRFPTMSRGELADWMHRMRCLPKAHRRKLWISLARALPRTSMKYFKELYRSMIGPDRRREKQ